MPLKNHNYSILHPDILIKSHGRLFFLTQIFCQNYKNIYKPNHPGDPSPKKSKNLPFHSTFFSTNRSQKLYYLSANWTLVIFHIHRLDSSFRGQIHNTFIRPKNEKVLCIYLLIPKRDIVLVQCTQKSKRQTTSGLRIV